jgi:hypothetical protein
MMHDIFRRLNTAYSNNDFGHIFEDPHGGMFLKLRSISRAELLRQFAAEIGLNIDNVGGRQLFERLFVENIPEQTLNRFIKDIYLVEREERRNNEDNLYSQLYQLANFSWGGFYQNAVEQTIVNNYVKKIADYGELLNRIETDLNPRLKGYILCSWYNHWTSILIEDMFKDHPSILPTVGLVKKVDFFWNDFPFDLKVTYFPEGFMKLKRQQKGLRPELTELKAFARAHGIAINRNLNDDELFRELLARIEENPSEEAKAFTNGFHRNRRDIIDEAIADPNELIVWFYENQGTRRFDAANRFFLVLIDRNNLEESWKLKRNRDILQSGISDYLTDNQNVDFNQFRLSFNWEGNVYNSYATCLFLTRE